ncbi:MAG: hypothetical protein GY772_21790, partial [bacterium]|nr:hypothetical protein [bacterium]
VEDYERDYAEKTAQEVLNMIQRLCTPRSDVFDTVLFEDVLAKTFGLVVDGALLKTGQQLKATRMPHIRLILRDPSHIIRATCRDPLHDAAQFKEQYDRLFGSRHAILKDFQNSVVWQDQLEACQRRILENGGTMGGDVRTLLRHFDFVQPRFESFVTPRRRYVCLLRAIAHVLAMKAGDERVAAEVRQRASAALAAMTPADCFTAGLAGDYGEVCLEFLRLFDVNDHDPARTAPEMEGFTRVLRDLFVNGYIVCEPEPLPRREAAKTLSQIVLDNIAQPLILRCSQLHVFRCHLPCCLPCCF